MCRTWKGYVMCNGGLWRLDPCALHSQWVWELQLALCANKLAWSHADQSRCPSWELQKSPVSLSSLQPRSSSFAGAGNFKPGTSGARRTDFWVPLRQFTRLALHSHCSSFTIFPNLYDPLNWKESSCDSMERRSLRNLILESVYMCGFNLKVIVLMFCIIKLCDSIEM